MLHQLLLPLEPHKTDAELRVDADAPLACPVAHERFEAVAGWGAQILETFRKVELNQFSQRRAGNIREARHMTLTKQRLSLGALERLDGHVYSNAARY